MDLGGKSRCSDFEKARLISFRTRRIDAGSPPRVRIQENDTAEKIAMREYFSNKLTQFDIGRVHADGNIEYIPVSFLYHQQNK
jgi:DNA-directed RNA polymerase subunit K/omega